MIVPNEVQRDMMRHALGLDVSKAAYRNHYDVGLSLSEAIWRDLVSNGFAVQRGARTFHVTRAGFMAVARPGETFSTETFGVTDASGSRVDALEAENKHLRAELAATTENLLGIKSYDAETDLLDREHMEAHGRDGNELERTALRARLECRLGTRFPLWISFAMEAINEVVKEDLAAMTPEERTAARERLKAAMRARLEARRADAG